MQVRHYDYLHHNHVGVVSLSGDASEVVITLTKAIYLDSSYQVTCRRAFCHAVFLSMQPFNVGKSFLGA